ncbi:patatin-like phospholipase family protein [Nocardioides limicola]|uniref:patatin-like phospholipase family protein n=1 Tax=Nocardioides limicola TaxID=2803368 RepID=UPI00193BDA1B|nr:patatin-like phospholipase family protein [Nocardioides sp. DJM-14]
MTRALAIGCGGTLGFAWTAVALRALETELDWDARTADILIGTSAGAEIVAALGSGHRPQDLLDALDGHPDADALLARHVATHPGHLPPLPLPLLPATGLIRAGLQQRSAYTALAGLLPRGRGDATWLREYGDALATDHGWTTHTATWIVAADAATGARVAFGAPGAPEANLGEAIAASWAIPGWFPPVTIGDRRYVDGGAVSSVSADLLLEAGVDEVIIVAPMTSEGGAPARGVARVERVLRRQMTRGLDAEVDRLRAAGVRVRRIEPGPAELEAMGANFMDLRRRGETLGVARRGLDTSLDRRGGGLDTPPRSSAALDHRDGEEGE